MFHTSFEVKNHITDDNKHIENYKCFGENLNIKTFMVTINLIVHYPTALKLIGNILTLKSINQLYKFSIYGISTIVGYLMPNLLYTYILNIYDLVGLAFMAYQPL